MSEALIRQNIETRLKAWADGLSLQTVFENVQTTPPASLYLRGTLLPAPTEDESLAGTLPSYSGVYQIDVVGLAGVGSKAVDDAVAGLRTVFVNANRQLLTGLTLVQTSPLQVSQGLPEDGRYLVPTRLSYRADPR